MLGLPNIFQKPKKTDEEIKKEQQKARDAIVARAQALKPLVLKSGTGWSEYVGLIKDYIDKCKKRKAITALDQLVAGNPEHDRVIHELKLLDHEIYILSWILQFPFDEIEKAEKIIKEGNKENSNGNG